MFEGMLAKKYILAQKRHSALTICSIAIALALITMLFTTFSTVMEWLYEINYDATPYHITMTCRYSENKEEIKGRLDRFIEEFRDEYGTVEVVHYIIGPEYSDETRADFFFEKPLPFGSGKYTDAVIKDMLKEQGFSEDDYDGIFKIQRSQLGRFRPIDDLDRAQWIVLFLIVFVLILFIIFALRLLIDTAFEISSKERERQFGVLQSVGATPAQIARIMTVEGLVLSAFGIPLGILLGLGVSYLVFVLVMNTGFSDMFFTSERAAELLKFNVNPLFLVIAAITGLVWVMLSAYGTGLRVVRKPPIESINARKNTVKKVKKKTLFGKIFGWTGVLAARNNMRQPKRFMISVVSLTVSITLFAAVSTAVSIGEKTVTDLFGSYGWEFEFEAQYTGGRYDPDYGIFAYQEGIERIKESGMFTEPLIYHFDSLSTVPDGYSDDAELEYVHSEYSVVYVNKPLYEYIFRNIHGMEPPVSYEELTETNSYILDDIFGIISKSGQDKSGEFTVRRRDVVTAYGGKDSINSEYLDDFTEESYTEGGETKIRYNYDKRYNYTLKIAGYVNDTFKPEKVSFRGADFIGTMDSFENGEYFLTRPNLKMLKNQTTYASVGCDLINPDNYEEAKRFFERNPDVFGVNGFEDNFESVRQMKSLFNAISITANSLNIMFALIAIINMVNILSTGIINRRGELATLQSIGMSEKQLNKMTVLECLQYVFVSGIASIIACEALVGLTLLFAVISNISMGVSAADSIDTLRTIFGSLSGLFTTPLLRVLIAVVPAFIAALFASFIPLRGIKKRSLVEQIRSVE